MMDVEMFREKYLAAKNRPKGALGNKAANKTLTPWPAEKGGAEKIYRSWLQQQVHKSSQQTRNVAKIDAAAVLSDIGADRHTNDPLDNQRSYRYQSRDSRSEPAAGDALQVRCEESQVSRSEEVYVIGADQHEGYAKPYVQPTAPDRVDIPEEFRRSRDRLYRLGDAFYSPEGEFLYRVPGAGDE